jgi:hypothetical protein
VAVNVQFAGVPAVTVPVGGVTVMPVIVSRTKVTVVWTDEAEA